MKKIIFLVMLFFNFSLNSMAQFTLSDSSFLDLVFAETPYQDTLAAPGNWYFNPPFYSMPDFFNLIDSNFKFHSSDFNHAYERVELGNFKYDTLINTTMNYYYTNFGNAYEQLNPLVIQEFSLNGINASAYSTFSEGNLDSTCSVGYLIIPGSNNSQTTELIKGLGYHNINCQIKNKLLSTGDVYIYCKPLEDYRAILWNQKKLNSSDYVTPGSPSYAYYYLHSINKPYGVNYLIECLALIKMMKKKYQKVVVVGLSMGGYSALITALNAPVDDAIIASGYSILFDTEPDVIYELHSLFDTLPLAFPSQVIKDSIAQSNKNFYFSWANNDNSVFQLEHDSSYTSNFFNGLLNCHYFTNFNYHSFPTCVIMDTIIDKTQNHSVARLKETMQINNQTCQFKIAICPSGNYKFQITRNGFVIDSFSNVHDTISYSTSDTGNYKIINIQNNQGQIFTCLDSFKCNIIPNSTLEFELNEEHLKIVNPVRSELNILGLKTNEKVDVIITNMNGQKVVQFYQISYIDKLFLQHLPLGLYMAKVIRNGNVEFHKLLKL